MLLECTLLQATTLFVEVPLCCSNSVNLLSGLHLEIFLQGGEKLGIKILEGHNNNNNTFVYLL